MKNKKPLFLLLAAAIGVSLVLAGCNDQNAASGGGYPLTTCVVSGESLTSMGDPVVYNYKGTTVKFCCEDCIKDFNKDPEKYLAKLNAARR
jgi:YHS domain-containing protein